MAVLQPRMRAGDRDRQRVVELLGKHFAEGRLTVGEFDERVVRAHAAVYLDELPALTADLPHEQPVVHRHPHRARTRPVPSAVVVLLGVVLVWSLIAAVVITAVMYGAPVLVACLVLFLFLRRRQWSRRW